jgi:hypothetical protein
MAEAVGLAPSTIHRIWKAFSLQPRRAETFKLSTDPLFVEKVRDIVGLYLSPPERAMVLCVDEKSHIQALDRTQPLLPMRPGQVERRTHDYTRHGPSAALDAATGRIIGKCFARHRAREFRAFLNVVEVNVPGDLDVHVIMDNVSTHKTQAIRNWLAKRPRWHTHYTPTSASWISLVERFFANLTDKQSVAAPIAPPKNSRPRSSPISTLSTQAPSRSSGPNPPTTFSLASSGSARLPSASFKLKPKSQHLRNQDTR